MKLGSVALYRKKGRGKSDYDCLLGRSHVPGTLQPRTSDSSFSLTTALQGQHRVALSISQIRNLNLKEVKGLLLVNGRAKI